jgi:hypothetical protein
MTGLVGRQASCNNCDHPLGHGGVSVTLCCMHAEPLSLSSCFVFNQTVRAAEKCSTLTIAPPQRVPILALSKLFL